MAQAGYTPISLYYSTTASASPSAGNLVAGELALNTLDEKLYFKNSAGTVKLLASTASTLNVSSITFGSTGLTPNTATTGAVTVGGTLATTNGGTGSTSTTYCSLTTNVTGTLPIANGGTGSASTTYCSLTTNVTGTLPVANGGTGVASATAYALLAGGTTTTGPFQSIASVGTAGQVLTSNGAGALPTFQAASGGVTTISFGSTGLTPSTATSGAVSVAGTLAIANGGTGSTSTTYCSLTANVTGTLPVANGGTGATTITANSVILGNGTSALNANLVAPGTAGNVLTSNGSTWTSAAAGGGQLKAELFTAPGTWTKPSSASQVIVTVVGGGGGGNLANGNAQPGNSGSTSSFGPAVSCTGGGGGGASNNQPGTPGSGTVSVGTSLNTAPVSPRGSAANSYLTLAPAIRGLFVNDSNPGNASTAYSTTLTFIAGSGGSSPSQPSAGNSRGGFGGVAVAVVPVSAPVAITVGAGGTCPGNSQPNVNFAGTGGAILVEFVG
jgi:hypothetical protein